MQILIPLNQHVGPPCKALVAPGETVEKGQVLAEPQGLGAFLHASVRGKIAEVSDAGILIAPDAQQPQDFAPIPETNDLVEAVKYAGVVGAGGAGFPSHVKLQTDLSDGCVIVNCAECEPLLLHNIKLLEEYPEMAVRGLKYLQDVTNAPRGYIAVKEKNAAAAKALEKVCAREKDIQVFYLPDKYPSGDERVIVREILGVELEPGQLPVAAGALVHNIETVKRIVEAIEQRKPVITKDLTVAGRVKNARKGQVFLDASLGTPVSHFIEKCGGYVEPSGEIVLGGPFTGKAGNESSPVTKISGGILVGMPFPAESRKVGILACECGAQEDRLKEIARGMDAEVVAAATCKRMVDVNGRLRCDKPGVCPGQAETVLQLKKKGIQVLLTGSCGD